MNRMLETKYIEKLKALCELFDIVGTKIEFGGDVFVDGNLQINEAENLIDKNGDPIIGG